MNTESIKTGVALVGCGTVGGSTADLLISDRKERLRRSGIDLELKYIVDRNFDNARKLGLSAELFCEDLDVALADDSVTVVIELVGGTGFARDLIARALRAGKHVVTANKALLAHHGGELYRIARENGVSLAFEASCGGGIPIIRALIDGLMANNIDAMFGIVNGTCNYILTEMIDKGQSYAEALAEAQASGLAEADPSLDVNGSDSAHKIAIMGSLAFGEAADLDKIPVQGIDTLEASDVAFGAEMGYIIKLIASAIRTPEGMFLRVEPAFISSDHPLAWVSGLVQRRQRVRPQRRPHHVLRPRSRRQSHRLGRGGRCGKHSQRKLSPPVRQYQDLAGPHGARAAASAGGYPPALLPPAGSEG
jgi:homoserine dehydrogenase